MRLPSRSLTDGLGTTSTSNRSSYLESLSKSRAPLCALPARIDAHRYIETQNAGQTYSDRSAATICFITGVTERALHAVGVAGQHTIASQGEHV